MKVHEQTKDADSDKIYATDVKSKDQKMRCHQKKDVSIRKEKCEDVHHRQWMTSSNLRIRITPELDNHHSPPVCRNIASL